jgi:hypothetical protein
MKTEGLKKPKFRCKKLPFNGKSPCLAVKISHIATVKYATTRKADLNFKFLGLNDKNISNTIENSG